MATPLQYSPQNPTGNLHKWADLDLTITNIKLANRSLNSADNYISFAF